MAKGTNEWRITDGLVGEISPLLKQAIFGVANCYIEECAQHKYGDTHYISKFNITSDEPASKRFFQSNDIKLEDVSFRENSFRKTTSGDKVLNIEFLYQDKRYYLDLENNNLKAAIARMAPDIRTAQSLSGKGLELRRSNSNINQRSERWTSALITRSSSVPLTEQERANSRMNGSTKDETCCSLRFWG